MLFRSTSCYEKYSERSIQTVESGDIAIADDDQFRFVYSSSTTVDTLADLISGANGTAAYTYIQYDFRAWNGGSDDTNYYLNFTIGDSSIDSCDAADLDTNTVAHCTEARYGTGLIGQALINAPGDKIQGFGPLTGTQPLRVNVEVNPISGTLGDTLSAGTSYPITMDFVTFGQSNDGVASSDRHNNGIWRVEVDETETNSGIFVGELDFIMLNQINEIGRAHV